MSETLEIKKLIDGVSEKIVAMQSKNDELEKKYDGLTKTEIKQIGEKMTEALGAVEVLKGEVKASEEKSKRLEAMMSRGASNQEGKSSNAAHAEYKNAFTSYLRKRDLDVDTKTDDYIRSIAEEAFKGTSSKDLDIAVKTLRSDIGPDGGYFIMPEKGAIIKGRYFETTPMTELATVRQIASNAIQFPLDDQQIGEVQWTGQIDLTPTVTTPQIGQITIYANEVQAKVAATQSMLDDMPDIESWLMDKVNDKFYRNLNTTYVSGDGASKPKGFLSYAAWNTPSTIAGQTAVYQRNAIEQIASGNATEVTGDGIKCLYSSLLEEYQNNAVFLMKRMTWETVSILKDGQGRYLLNPATQSIQNGTDLTLLGRPVVFANDMQAVGADSLSVAYGDFKRGYTIVERLGMRILRDPYTATPQVLYKAFRRVGGEVTNFQAIKLLKCAA
jgi:HK97 family phage major capsid protein